MLTEHLSYLAAGGLIRPFAADPEWEYLFRHALLHDAAYHSLLRGDRKRLHGIIGTLLESEPAGSDDRAPLLARHFALAGDRERALRYYEQAGDTAAARYANQEAAAHYGAACDLLHPATDDGDLIRRLYEKRGRALELINEFGAAEAAYRALETLGQTRADRRLELAGLTARSTVWVISNMHENRPACEALCQAALALAQELGDERAEARCRWNLLLFYGLPGSPEVERAVAYGEQALALARRLDLREQLAYILNDIAFFGYIATARFAQASAALQEARDLWREAGNLPLLANNLANAAASAYFLGQYDSARALGEEAVAISRSIGNIWGQAFSAWATGLPCLEQGDLPAAIAWQTQAVELGLWATIPSAQVMPRIYLALGYLLAGRPEAALPVAQEAFDWATTQHPPWTYPTQVNLALCRLWMGDPAAAEALVPAFRPVDQGDIWFHPVLVMGTGELALARRDYAGLLAWMEGFLAEAAAHGIQPCRAEALYYQARAHLALDQVDQAAATLAAAQDLVEQLGGRMLWPILAARALCAARQGDLTTAATLRAEARVAAEAQAARFPDPTARAAFLAQPQIQALAAG